MFKACVLSFNTVLFIPFSADLIITGLTTKLFKPNDPVHTSNKRNGYHGYSQHQYIYITHFYISLARKTIKHLSALLAYSAY